MKERVFEYLTKKPNANIYELYFEFKNTKKTVLKTYKCLFRKEKKQFSPDYIKDIKILLGVMSMKMNPNTKLSKKGQETILRLSDLVRRNTKVYS